MGWHVCASVYIHIYSSVLSKTFYQERQFAKSIPRTSATIISSPTTMMFFLNYFSSNFFLFFVGSILTVLHQPPWVCLSSMSKPKPICRLICVIFFFFFFLNVQS